MYILSAPTRHVMVGTTQESGGRNWLASAASTQKASSGSVFSQLCDVRRAWPGYLPGDSCGRKFEHRIRMSPLGPDVGPLADRLESTRSCLSRIRKQTFRKLR